MIFFLKFSLFFSFSLYLFIYLSLFKTFKVRKKKREIEFTLMFNFAKNTTNIAN